MGRERPPPHPKGMLCKCELHNAPAPDPGSKKGGRSCPPPISRIGTADPGVGDRN